MGVVTPWGELEPFEDSFLAAPAGHRVGAVDPDATVRLIGVLKNVDASARFLAFVQACGFAASPLGSDGKRFELSGTFAGVERAFRPEGLGLYEEVTARGTRRFVGRSGRIYLPAQCLLDVLAVMGIDQRHRGRPAAGKTMPNVHGLYSPRDIAARYDFPTSWDGTGQTVGVIALGGGYREDELVAYLQDQGVHWTGSISAVSADNRTVNAPDFHGTNQTHVDNVFEVQMDVSVIAAVAPGAQIVVYFGESPQPNGTKGLYAALYKAICDDQRKPTVISVSWEFPRSTISLSCANAFEVLLKESQTRRITVCVASGDQGAFALPHSNKPDVAFPACSKYVLACGGTALDGNGLESAWGANARLGSGGGYSSKEPMPSYQQGTVKPGMGRGVPDVAAMAMPGYDSVCKSRWDGRPFTGTSAATPLWAALIVLINQGRRRQAGMSVGFINETLYQHKNTVFVDIQSGSNTAFQAARGWDEITGLGTPRGSDILRLF